MYFKLITKLFFVVYYFTLKILQVLVLCIVSNKQHKKIESVTILAVFCREGLQVSSRLKKSDITNELAQLRYHHHHTNSMTKIQNYRVITGRSGRVEARAPKNSKEIRNQLHF